VRAQVEDISQYLLENKIHPRKLLEFQVDKYNTFRRWDTIIRCIAAEHYIKTGKMHPLYKKDCDLRWLYIHKSYDTYNTEITKGYFEKTIESFLSYGAFDKDEPLSVNKDLLLFDGTHRLGVALAMKLDCVFFEIDTNAGTYLNADFDYYKERFTESEVNLIKCKYDEIMKD
jgi:hypothetical protein